MTASTDPRVATVLEHMRLENAKDFAACIAVFSRARYDVVAEDQEYDGAHRVDDFLVENVRAFPDFEFVPSRIGPTPDAVVVEGRFQGTHLGSWRGLPATGRRVDLPMCVVFDFEGEAMVTERLYFDLGTALRQLGVADDPNSLRGKVVMIASHPLVVGRAALRALLRRR